MNLLKLNNEQGWKLHKAQDGSIHVCHEYTDIIGMTPLRHPVLVHLDIFRKHTDPAVKYQHLKIAHQMLWPTRIWHEWTARRYRTHCEDYNYITLAAGASAAKSADEAAYAILFWYANPSERNVTIASVTLASLLGRVWGYLTAYIKEMAIPLPYKYYRSSPPKILLEEPKTGKNKIEDDTLHGIFAVTAKTGDDDQAVATWIGKHPKDKILLILDECTDMPMSILNALPNLNSHPEKFQLVGIGNSNSTQDMHGLLSTPRGGWDSVSPDLISWPTTQPKGICLYFSPYESPAVIEEDPERRAILEKFLIGREGLKNKEIELGTDSEKFYRWVLGFWKSRDTDLTIASEKFVRDKDYDPTKRIEWSGHYPNVRVAGLDPAFSTSGDNCILRIANVSQAMDRKVKIDLGGGGLTFEIKLKALHDKSIEKQIALEAFPILIQYGVPLDRLAIDVTGQGRALGEVFKLLNEQRGHPLGYGTPLKIYSMSPHNLHKNKKSAPDIVPMNSYELWTTIRKYMEHGQIGNLDAKTKYQLVNRQIIETEVNGKKMYRLESKKEYKRRMSAIGNPHSPDEADGAALVLQVVERVLGIKPGTTWENPTVDMKALGYDRIRMQQEQERPGSRAQAMLQALTPSGNGELGAMSSYIKHKRPF